MRVICTILVTLSILLAPAGNVYAQLSQIFSTGGAYTFTPPSGVTSISVECWGAGGASGNNTGGRARGGGGGGAYTGGTISVTPGVPITIVVGDGGIYSNNPTTADDGGQSSAGAIIAKGGARGIIGNNVAQNGGAGGAVSTNPGGVTSFISFAGGKGGNGYVANDNGGGGGGGESASASGAGNNGGNGTQGGNGGAGGAGNAGGGEGGRGSNNDGNPNSTNGISPGGGGGGRGDYQGNNTNGAAGQVIISWSNPSGYCTGNALSVSKNQNAANPTDAVGAPDGHGAHLNETNDQLTLELITGNPLTAGGSVDVIWQRVSNNATIIEAEISENGTTWTHAGSYTNINPRNSWITQSIPLPADTRYIRFTSMNGYDLDIDAITFSTPCAPTCVIPIVYNVTGGGVYCSGTGLPINCSGSETGVTYQLFLGANPQGSPVSGTGGAINFGNQVTAGTYTIIATRLAGGCTATMNGNAVISFSTPAQSSAITGPTTSCIGASQTYSVINVPGVSYAWTFPSGWIKTAGGTGNSVIVTAGTNAGNITVTPSNACGTGTARSLTVTTTTALAAQPGTISGPVSPCASAGLSTYSVPNVAGMAYSWSFPAGWSITSGQGTNSVTVNAGATAGNVSVTASNTCGTSTAQTLAVTSGTPPNVNISANYCAGGGYIRLTANGGGAGATYLWSTDETTQQILVNIAGQYTVEVTTPSGCSATAVYNVSTELVVNGDFSAGNTGFTHSTYIFNADIAGNTELNPEGHYGVGTDPQAYHSNFWGRDHTTGTGNFMIINGYPGAPQPVVWATNVAVVPGVSYYFSAWALSLNTAGNYAVLQFRVNGSLVGTTAPLPARAQNNNSPFNWIQFYGTWTAPAGVFSVPIEIVDSQTAAAGNDFGLDDISFATLAPLPAVISPSSNATTFCIGQTLQLFANLTGGKAPFTFSWTGPDGFTSALENPVIPNVTAAKSGIYQLTITDGYGCTPVTASASPITVVSPPPCSIAGPATLCPSSTGNIYTAAAGMTSYAWSINGNGSITGITNGRNVTVTAGAVNNSPVTLSLAMTDVNGCSLNCQQTFMVEDNTPPTFTLPLLSAGYCVEYVSQALYNPGQENTPLDITYTRPDYYLVGAGSNLLNLGAVADNCALALQPIAWSIDFGNNGSVEFSGTGQFSAYGADVQFPLGTSRISYTVTDAAGNMSVKFVDLVVTPRPVISNIF